MLHARLATGLSDTLPPPLHLELLPIKNSPGFYGVCWKEAARAGKIFCAVRSHTEINLIFPTDFFPEIAPEIPRIFPFIGRSLSLSLGTARISSNDGISWKQQTHPHVVIRPQKVTHSLCATQRPFLSTAARFAVRRKRERERGERERRERGERGERRERRERGAHYNYDPIHLRTRVAQ